MKAGTLLPCLLKKFADLLDRMLRAGNTSTASNPNPENKKRDLIVMGALIEHPQAGLILFETGCAENVDIVSGKCSYDGIGLLT